MDECPLLPSATWVQAAVFADECPEDPVLAKGDVSAAVRVQTVAADQAFAAVEGLASGSYGFTVVVRDAQCAVMGFGCTRANIPEIAEIRTSVRNWVASDICSPGVIGACVSSQTCSAGECVP